MKQKSRKFIAYYRVSTDRQGLSKLGLEAQQEAVRQYLADGDVLVSEVVEVESGKRATARSYKRRLPNVRNRMPPYLSPS